jgi:hypothetical protein
MRNECGDGWKVRYRTWNVPVALVLYQANRLGAVEVSKHVDSLINVSVVDPADIIKTREVIHFMKLQNMFCY